MSHFVIVVPESWLHQWYAASVCADCSVPTSTVLSLGFPLLIIQLPFIYSLGISQSCKFGVNLYDVLNIATSLFELLAPCQQIFYLFLKLWPFSLSHGARDTVDSLSGSVWWLNESSFPVVLFIVGVFLSLLGSKLSLKCRAWRPTIFVVITIHTCPEVTFERYLLTKCWCFILFTILPQLYSLYSVMIFF